MVILVRLDLDHYTLPQISAFIKDGVVTPQEGTESKAYRELSELEQLTTYRMWAKTYKK